jgi:CMP-N,N'-diacetyllegionaminic acid synthase
MKKKVVAVVPVRKGSQRVKSKNTRPFSHTSLLELKLRVLKHVKGIDEIIVNTDCEESLRIANSLGIATHIRDPQFANSQVTNDQHWRHIAETTDTDILLMAQTTSPLVTVKTYQDALNQFFNLEGENDSINSVSPEKKFLWLDGQALNYDSHKTPKSQDLPNIVSLNFAITIINRQVMINRENVIGSNPFFITLSKSESVDIDDQSDFDYAEFLYERLGFDWLINTNQH